MHPRPIRSSARYQWSGSIEPVQPLYSTDHITRIRSASRIYLVDLQRKEQQRHKDSKDFAKMHALNCAAEI